MNRFKLLLLLLIVAILATIFIQNREPVALKLLCEDPRSQYCLYQTPQLPLAAWISLFLFGGAMTSILSQVFSRYSYSGLGRKKYVQDNSDPDPNWVDRDAASTTATTTKARFSKGRKNDTSIYEAAQEPQEVERSGSNYSYKYRPNESDRNGKNQNSTSIDLGKNSEGSTDTDDEDWI